MGAPNLAVSKFYAVMTTSLRLKLDRLDYYQRLVLQAQTEVADTYYLQGKFGEAAEYLNRLLKLDNPQLNKSQIIYKMIRSLAAMNRHTDVVAQAESFLTQLSPIPGSRRSPLPAGGFALKKQGRTREATQQVFDVAGVPADHRHEPLGNWIYWQQRTGNEIANQLYKEGDYLNALDIYQKPRRVERCRRVAVAGLVSDGAGV
jgi:tetratricopeptide (TPR) repeat protein